MTDWNDHIATVALERHFRDVDARSQAAQAYASLIINILATLNGGAIVAVISFIGAVKAGEIVIGAAAIISFSIAFLLIILSAAQAFHFNSAVYLFKTEAQIVLDGVRYTYQPEVIDKINAANKIRMASVIMAYVSLLFSALGFALFITYLTTINPAGDAVKLRVDKVAPTKQVVGTAKAIQKYVNSDASVADTVRIGSPTEQASR